MFKQLIVGFCGLAILSAVATGFVVDREPGGRDYVPLGARQPAHGAGKTTATGIAWQPTFEAAMAMAKSKNQLVMVDFYTDECVYCKKLDAEAYHDSDVIAQSQNFVNVKVDADKRNDLAMKYKVYGLPSVVFMDSTGNVIDRQDGYSVDRVDHFSQWQRDTASRFSPSV